MTIPLKLLRRAHCHTRLFCVTCRSNADWRESVTGVREFTCPHKVTLEQAITQTQSGVWPVGVKPRPPKPSPDERTLRLAIARAGVCTTCPDLDPDRGGIKLTVVSGIGTSYPLTVACKLCKTCGGGVSLVKAARVCKLGKWDNIQPSDPNHR